MPTEEAEGTFGVSPFYPANNNNNPKTVPQDTSLVWRDRLICQQMYCLWLRSAYLTDDSAEIWKAAVSYYNILYLAWGLWCAMNGRAAKFALPDWWEKAACRAPSFSLKTQQFSVEEMKCMDKAFWNVPLSPESSWSQFPPVFVATAR